MKIWNTLRTLPIAAGLVLTAPLSALPPSASRELTTISCAERTRRVTQAGLSVREFQVGQQKFLDPTGRYAKFSVGDLDTDWVWDIKLNATFPVSVFEQEGQRTPVILSFIPGTRRALIKENAWSGSSVTGSRLSQVNMDTGEGQILVPEFPTEYHQSVVSPDGSKILFVSTKQEDANAVVLDLISGTQQRYLLQWPHRVSPEIFHSQLSNDGFTLASRDSSNGRTLVWKLPPDSQSPQPVKARGLIGRLIYLANNGEWVVSENPADRVRLHRSTPSGLKNIKLGGMESLDAVLSDRTRTLKPIISDNGQYLVIPFAVDVPSESHSPQVAGSVITTSNTDFDTQWTFARWSLASPSSEPSIFTCPRVGLAGLGRMDFSVTGNGEILVAGTNAREVFIWHADSNRYSTVPRLPQSEGWESVSNLAFSADASRLVVQHEESLSVLDLPPLASPQRLSSSEER